MTTFYIDLMTLLMTFAPLVQPAVYIVHPISSVEYFTTHIRKSLFCPIPSEYYFGISESPFSVLYPRNAISECFMTCIPDIAIRYLLLKSDSHYLTTFDYFTL